MKLVLVDTNPEMVKAWRKEFSDVNDVVVVPHTINIFNVRTEAIVSPANTRGIMRGGFDAVLAKHFGEHTEMIVQNHLKENFNNSLVPIGDTAIVDMPTGNFDKLIIVPTMIHPGEDIKHSRNVFDASKGLFALLFDGDVESVVCTGLGTGVGRITPEECARDMREAWDAVSVGL